MPGLKINQAEDKHMRDSDRDCYTFREHLKQVYYWQDRFELSREISHLDNAERHAEVVKEYLPKSLQEMSIFWLSNYYLSLQSLITEIGGENESLP